jgi:hypothetical protein
VAARIRLITISLLNFSLSVVYCSGQEPLALKSLAVRALAHVLLEEDFAAAIENIKNVFYVLNSCNEYICLLL